MTTDEILSRLTDLHKTVGVSIYGGDRFVSSYGLSDKTPHWTVDLVYEQNDTKLEITTKGETLDEALKDAWRKFERAALTGLPNGALTPPIEVAKIEEYQESKLNDEIPL